MNYTQAQIDRANAVSLEAVSYTHLERFGKSAMIRYVSGIDQPIYPIAYIKNKIPMAKKAEMCIRDSGSPGEEMRLFLTEDGYQAALQSQQRREIKIKRYARVIEGPVSYTHLRGSRV